MAELVQKHLERAGKRVRARRRTLPDQDFRFRGGFPHPPGARTRLTDAGTKVSESGGMGS
jgi:hypothetical protein